MTGTTDRLASRLRRLVREEIRNTGSTAEHWTVKQVAPLIVEQLQGDLVLEEGDPDFIVGGWLRRYEADVGLVVSDQILVTRAGDVWHAVDVAA